MSATLARENAASIDSERQIHLTTEDEIASNGSQPNNYGLGMASSIARRGNKQSAALKGKTQQAKKEKMINLNTVMQKKFTQLRRTSKSRFDGVQKYFYGAYLSKQMPIPTFNGQRDSDQHDQSRQSQQQMF